MSLYLIPNRPIAIAEWVRRRIADVSDFGPCGAIGVWSTVRQDIVAGIVYSQFDGRSLQMSIASDDPSWCTRGVLRCLFDYPFNQLRCARVAALTLVTADHTRAFLQRAGFSYEGCLREGFPSGDVAIYGMLRRECRWLRGSGRGEEIRQQLTTAAAA